MALLNRLLRIPPEEVAPGEFRYEARRIGALLCVAGGVMMGGAIAAGAAVGFEGAGAVLAAGMVVESLGTVAVIASAIPDHHEM